MRLLDLVLDRQPVAVPARHVTRVVAGELARLDDHVLEDLVDRMPDVQRAVGIRRAVVQHEQRRAAARVAQPAVQALRLPLRDPARLAPGQVAAHRERRVGQVERLAVVGGGHGLVAAASAASGGSSGAMRRPCDGVRRPAAGSGRAAAGRPGTLRLACAGFGRASSAGVSTCAGPRRCGAAADTMNGTMPPCGRFYRWPWPHRWPARRRRPPPCWRAPRRRGRPSRNLD